MERDRENHQWFTMNTVIPSPSSPPHPPTHNLNSILHLTSQFNDLSLFSAAAAAAAHPGYTTPSAVNPTLPLSNSWIPASGDLALLPREVAAPTNYPPFDLHRLRVCSAVPSSSGSSGLGSGSFPTRIDYMDSYDHLCAEALMIKLSMLANGDVSSGSTPNNLTRQLLVNQVPTFNPADLLDRSLPYNRSSNSNKNLNSNTRRSRNNHHNNSHHHHQNHSDFNSNNNGGMMNNLQSNTDMKLPSWEELRERIASLSMDQQGCTILQCMLPKSDLPMHGGLEIPVSEVKSHISEIITNEFGIEFFKKLLEFCDDRHVYEILCALMVNNDHFLEICLHSRGTYAVQRLLNKVNKNDPSHRGVVASAMVPNALTLSKDNNGNYVMIACLKAFEGFNDVIAPILEEIGNHCLEIAQDKSGCCVLQQCLAQPEGQVGRQRLLSLIISNAYQLSEHEYGNYVVQYVIGMRSDLTNSQVIRKLQGSFAPLSRSKYGSHVVEKCLKDARDEKVKLIIKELTEDPSFVQLLQDPMGNYVVQTALHRSKARSSGYGHIRSSLHQMLLCRIQSHYAFLNSHPFGKKVISHIKCKCKLQDFGFNVDFFPKSLY